MREIFWVIVIAAAILLAVALIVRAAAGRRRRPTFQVRPLPEGYASAYEARIVELQAMFVNHPREAVAGAKQVVDDMTLRMGYPTRLSERERLHDLASIDRRHADRYRLGTTLKPDSSTEQMRRAMQGYLDLGRELLGRGTHGNGQMMPPEGERPEVAG